ncbi:MAG: Rrf2 family transcriptional regulator [Candidatus Latescibacteria bacterium]|nr:Rrf2 family transcriptional regulator [bacterium]MBD3423123.1 Rrf2 family transcriptional regulator [Candidatus Latescibacterota bacterium]
MRISTRSRYGLRAMVEISRQGGAPLSCESIAEREGLSKKYLDRILSSLRRASLIESYRGQGGGYSLARPPEQISLNEVVAVLEEGLSIMPCVEDSGSCSRSESCSTRDVWRSVVSAVDEALAGITLADISGCGDQSIGG